METLGTIPQNVRETVLTGLRNKAMYESITTSLGASRAAAPPSPAPTPENEGGSGFWLIAFIIAIVSIFASLFGASESAPSAPPHGEPGESHDNGARY